MAFSAYFSCVNLVFAEISVSYGATLKEKKLKYEKFEKRARGARCGGRNLGQKKSLYFFEGQEKTVAKSISRVAVLRLGHLKVAP